jgi:hypothetical protein
MRKYAAAIRLDVISRNAANVLIVAPGELVGALVRIDESIVACLRPEGLIRMRFLRLFARSLPHSPRAVVRLLLDPGHYNLRIEKDGYEIIEKSFRHEPSLISEVQIEGTLVKPKFVSSPSENDL